MDIKEMVISHIALWAVQVKKGYKLTILKKKTNKLTEINLTKIKDEFETNVIYRIIILY